MPPSPPRFKRVREGGITFVFKYDKDAPDLLHIYARHLTEVDDALDVFFDHSAAQVENVEQERFERTNKTHGLYWFWLDEPTVVMVITCFTLENSNGEAS